ncbi:MAG: IS256 family transposase [Actinomycetota bacterium]
MVEPTVDPLVWLGKHLEEADTDLLREMLRTFIQHLMSAQADAICGAPYGERSSERVNQRNGYRQRPFDTRAGTIDLLVPKLRSGSYFPDWLVEPRRRAERALVQVVAECYVKGVSTRRVDGLVRTLGIEGISKSQVSELAKSLDEAVEAFRSRPLDTGPYTYLWLDALEIRCREAGRIVSVAAVVATAVNADGRREILGLDIFTNEDGAGWTSFLRGLVARGLSGVQLVISDDHRGLTHAIAAVLPGTSWQRCRVHFVRNLQSHVPKLAQPMVGTLVRSIFAQPSAQEVRAQLDRVIAQLEGRFPKAAEILAEAAPDITAFCAFPIEHWRQIWSNNPQERLNREIRRRTDVVGIFPNRDAIVRLVGSVLAEQHDEWQVCHRYMGTELLTKARMTMLETTEPREEVIGELVAAG